MTIVAFQRRSPQSPQSNPSGLFFCFPRRLQEERIRELSRRRLTPETISIICCMSRPEVTKIIEGHV